MSSLVEIKSDRYLNHIVRFVSNELDINLKESGNNKYTSYCPFHNDSRDSFRVNVNKKGEVRFHCYGACKIHMDIYELIQRRTGCSFKEACTRLAEYIRVSSDSDGDSFSPRAVPDKVSEVAHTNPDPVPADPVEIGEDVIAALEDAACFYNLYLCQPLQEKQYRYLLRRGLDDDTIRQFQIGYAEQYSRSGDESCGKKLLFANIDRFKKKYLLYYPYWKAGLLRHLDDETQPGFSYYHAFVDYNEKLLGAFGGYGDYFAGRLTFPVRDINGKVCGMVGRRVDNKAPRWVFPRTTETELNPAAWLYGIDKAAKFIRRYRTVILVEGIFDYFAVYKLFQDSSKPIVVSTLGCKLTSQAAKILTDLGVKNYIVAYDCDDAGRKAIRSVAKSTQGTVVFLGGMTEGQDPADALRKAINAIDGYSLAQLMEGTAKNRERFNKRVGFHMIACGPGQRQSLRFEAVDTSKVNEQPVQKPGDYLYRTDEFLPLLSYNHGNKAALDAKLTRILHQLNIKTVPADDGPTFQIPVSFIVDKRYEELGPGLILWLYAVLTQQQHKRRVKMTDAELAERLHTSRQTISKHKTQLVETGFLKIDYNQKKKTQRIAARFFPRNVSYSEDGTPSHPDGYDVVLSPATS